MKVELYCLICGKSEENIVTTGFKTQYGTIYEYDAFCPKHAAMADWLNAVCPGCIGGFSDCEFRQDMDNYALTLKDVAVVQSGKCPRRHSGTFMFTPGKGMDTLDLSDVAALEIAKATAEMIMQNQNQANKERD